MDSILQFNLAALKRYNLRLPHRWDRWLAYVISSGCGLLVGALIWNTYLLIATERMEAAAQQASPVTFTNPGWGSWLDRSVSDTIATPPATSAPEQQVTPINTKVTLIGIIGIGEVGVAIMRINGGEEQLYGPGDPVEEGVILKLVTPDGKAVVFSNGEIEKIYRFPEVGGLVNEFHPSLSQLPESAPIQAVPAPTQQPEVPQQRAQSTRSNTPARQQQLLARPQTRQKLQELREEPFKATQLADTEFVHQNGQLFGLRIGNLRNPELFQAVGLDRNDVVIAVNGASVAALAKDPVRAQALLRERSYRIEILRNGTRQIVNFAWPE